MFYAIVLASLIGIYIIVGFEAAAEMGEETIDAGRTVPRAIILSVVMRSGHDHPDRLYDRDLRDGEGQYVAGVATSAQGQHGPENADRTAADIPGDLPCADNLRLSQCLP